MPVMGNKTTHTDLRVAIAFFTNREDRKPSNRRFSWQRVIDRLSESTERPDKDGAAFVPAKFVEREYKSKDGGTYKAVLRRKNAVKFVSMAVFDYDEGVTPKEAAKHFRDFEHVIHTSFSHRKEKPKFRVVLPFAEPVKAENWNSCWLHLKDAARINGYDIDIACRDTSRLYYLPSHPPGGKSDFRYNAGVLLQPITTEHPSEAAPRLTEWKPAKTTAATGPGITLPEWLNAKGVNFRQKPGEPDVFQLYACPWGADHTMGDDDLGHAAVMVVPGGNRWGFSCCHDTCQKNGRNWAAFREHVAGPKRSAKRPRD